MCSFVEILCRRPFTQVIQDNQFSALGLTLVAAVSEIRRMVALPFEGEIDSDLVPSTDSVPVKTQSLELAEDFGEAVDRCVSLSTSILPGSDPASAVKESEPQPQDSSGLEPKDPRPGDPALDISNIVQVSSGRTVQTPQKLAKAERARASSDERMQKRKKSKKANPIDDLFQSLT